jgi:hypothetical protein
MRKRDENATVEERDYELEKRVGALGARIPCPSGCICPCSTPAPSTTTCPNQPPELTNAQKLLYCAFVNNGWEAQYHDWAVSWNTSNFGNPAYLAFSNFDWSRCTTLVANLTDVSLFPPRRVPFIAQTGSDPIGWAPNPQGIFGEKNAVSPLGPCAMAKC